MGMYKTQQRIASIEELAEAIKQKLGEKYPVIVKKADTGAAKYFTGNTIDTIRMKKNGYHGVVIGFSDNGEGGSIITSNSYTPNTVVEMITRKAGLLDKLIFRAIWGSGNEFYGDIHDHILDKYKATEMDTSLVGGLKQMFGKKSQ